MAPRGPKMMAPRLVPNIWNQFGTSLEPKRVGSKLVPNWFQIGSKHLEPVWNQFGTKTSWFQTGSKLVPNWFQTSGTSLEPVWNQNELVPNWFGTNSFWFQTGSKLVPRWTLTRNLRYFLHFSRAYPQHDTRWPQENPR